MSSGVRPQCAGPGLGGRAGARCPVGVDHLLGGRWPSAITLDPERVGRVGHSFGGWTVLAAPDGDPRVRAVVAHAPGRLTLAHLDATLRGLHEAVDFLAGDIGARPAAHGGDAFAVTATSDAAVES